MISLQKLAGALNGVGLIYKFDRRAWDFFDKSAEGFWNAYIVAVALAPLHVGRSIILFDPAKQSLDFVPYLIVEILTYILTWTLFPFVMLYIARLLDRTPRYLAYMVPYLWMQLPLALLLYSIQILTDLSLLPPIILGVTAPLVLVTFAVYGTFVAGIGLQVFTGTAMGLVVLDYVLGLLADAVISRI